MGSPTITVILPTRDRPRFLAAAIRSVLAQSLSPDELLVVDDGRQAVLPGIRSLLEEAPFAVRIVGGPRRGPAGARNAGLALARGELIAFLDDDDLWHPHKLAWQTPWFARRPRLGVLGSSCVRSAEPERAETGGLRRPRRLAIVSPRALVRANRLAMSSVVVRRECLAGEGFDDSLPLAQDWDLWLRLVERWEMAVVPAPLTIYRLHGEQRSREQVGMRIWEAAVLARLLARKALRPRLQGTARRRLSWAHYRLARSLLRAGDRAGASEEFRRSLCLNPFLAIAWQGAARCALASRAAAGAARP